MKRTVLSILALTFFFSMGLFAASKFQSDAQKKADSFSMERPLTVLAFDITKEREEEYETTTFVPDLSWKAKVKKFFTGKEQGTDRIDTHTRTITVINRVKLYTESKRKMYEVQEVTPSEINVISKRIFDGEDFYDIKKGMSAKKGTINVDFIAVSILPDWYYMHKRNMKDAIETEEEMDGKVYRFIKGKSIRYYVDKDTQQLGIVEYDSADKYNKGKKILNKVVFGPATFKLGKYNIVNKVSIYKGGKLVKQYNVSALKPIDVLKDSFFDLEIQTREVNKAPKKRKAVAAGAATETKSEAKDSEEKVE
ncbi:MAG: hypothetical protein A2231_00515 [Candidatus Firestonebacteria bacterium RIFOXYA2_FULL_40_8]|nr:MAG: hypothetical protein A2231_00515 [Candidatus Firestonebacteria bacterium RIFOXYA2_FULL_40_8]